MASSLVEGVTLTFELNKSFDGIGQHILECWRQIEDRTLRSHAFAEHAPSMSHPTEKRSPADDAHDVDDMAEPAHEVDDGTEWAGCAHPGRTWKEESPVARLAQEIAGPFDRGRGGPGGWHILFEPELPLVREEIVCPDLAGWRVERMPELPLEGHITLPPDWVGEVLNRWTEDYKRTTKMLMYAASGVRWAWLLDPAARTLEVFTLADDGRWGKPAVYRDTARVRAAPFDAIELHLSVLWAD
jgi:hypothetical protein